MLFRQIFDRYLAQYAYLVGCQQTREAIIIDPQRDVDRYFEAADEEGMTLVAAADTHIHADYLTGLRALAVDHGLMVYASGTDAEWRYEWLEGSSFNHRILHDGDTFNLGNVVFDVLHTPGHTPEHLSFLIVDRAAGNSDGLGLLTGDFVFVGDLGRPDLLESAAGHVGKMRPAARELFRSVQQFRNLPPWLQVWPGHGAGSACGKALGAVPQSTVGYEIRHNAAISAADHGEDAFIDAILEGQPDPPLYFGRMKTLNREGPPLLESLPQPLVIERADFARFADRTDVAVVDTREKEAFVAGHLSGSLLAPFDNSFCTTVGSYVEPGLPIYLIIEPENLEEAVRCLVRIGLDDVVGHIAPDEAEALTADADLRARTHAIGFEEVGRRLNDPDVLVLDVRSRSEYDASHLPGAANVPHTRLFERLDELPRDQELLVHCATGVRSAVASALLQRHGFRVQYVMDDYSAFQGAREGGEEGS